MSRQTDAKRKMVKAFEEYLAKRERNMISGLNSPTKIQAFLDEIPYSTEAIYRSPRRVLRDRRAHCFDGALFAAAMLRRLGYPPLIANMFAERDDEHLLAIYKQDGFFGAVAKSNFVGMRFREPIYKNLRELMMSYFEHYYNIEGKKTLRSYARPLNLTAFDRFNWMVCDDHLERIVRRLDQLRRWPLLTARMITHLSRVDDRSYKAGMLGLNPAGLYKPDTV